MRARSTSPARKQRRRPGRLEPEQRAEVVARPVERGVPEPGTVVRRQIDAAELEIARHVLQEVDELEPGADGVARSDELGVVEPPQHAEDEPAARVGRVDAVVLDVVPRLVRGHALIHAVRVDQTEERLAREIELAHGRLDVSEHGPRRLAVEGESHLRLELVERRETVAVVRVSELVDEPGVAVERAHVRTQGARKEDRSDREVLPGRPCGDSLELHSASIRASFAAKLQHCLNCAGRRGGRAASPRKERVVSEGNGPAQEGTAGIREDPIAGIARTDGSTVVSLAGELDLYNAHTVREALLECCAESPDRLIVDLSGVKFIDSTALGVLIEARTRMENRHGFLLAAPGLETRRALEISGLDRHFAVHESLDSAHAAPV